MKHSTLDNAVIGLLVVALLLTLAGTVMIIDAINGRYSLFTAAGTANASFANTSLTVSTVTAITFAINADNFTFGQGYVNASCTGQCVMSTNGVQNQTVNGSFTASSGCCTGWDSIQRGLLIENTGNINVSINFTCTSPNANGNCSASGFIGGSNPVMQIRFIPNSQRGQTGEYGATDTFPACHTYTIVSGTTTQSFANITMANFSESNLNRTPAGVCGNTTAFPLNYDNTMDALVADLNITIGSDAIRQNGTFTLNISAVSAG